VDVVGLGGGGLGWGGVRKGKTFEGRGACRAQDRMRSQVQWMLILSTATNHKLSGRQSRRLSDSTGDA